MTIVFPLKLTIPILYLLLLVVTGLGANNTGSHSSTSEKPPEANGNIGGGSRGVKKCYKCEGNCNGGLGRVEQCHPTGSGGGGGGDSVNFACYKSVVDGKTFQRGCTRDFSQGEECIEEKGRTYCFCRQDACNSSSQPPVNLIVIAAGVTLMIVSFQRFLSEII